MDKTNLIVVDMQNGFVNENSEHIVQNVRRLIQAFRDFDRPICFTRFRNYAGSGWVRWIGWKRFMDGGAEVALVDGLATNVDLIVDKTTYTSLTDEVRAWIRDSKAEAIVVCGIATDGCVLKTAVDIFETGLEPLVAVDACASHAGLSVHEAGILLLSRFIGRRQMRSVAEVISSSLSTPPEGQPTPRSVVM